MPKTYDPIATFTVATAQASYTFSSIPSTYTDLILIVTGTNTSAGGRGLTLRFNGDTATNYSSTYISGDGTSATSLRYTSTTYLDTVSTINQSTISNAIIQIQNYSNTTTFKTVISRSNSPADNTRSSVGLWRKTPEAINTILVGLTADNFAIGSTFTLYGIKAA